MIYTTQQTNTTATPNTLGGTYIHNGGQVLTTNGTSPYWIDSTVTIANATPNTLHVNGEAVFESDIKLKGKSLDKALTKIEERLAILHPNEKLEEKWEKLRDLRKQYMELEADIIEKEKIVEILKR